MTDTPSDVIAPKCARRVWLRRGLVATTVLGALAVGGWWWGMQQLKSGLERYVVDVVVPQAAAQKMVVKYDRIESGWQGVTLVNPLIVTRQNGMDTTFTTGRMVVRPSGWRAFALRMPDELVLKDAQAQVILQGDSAFVWEVTLDTDAKAKPRAMAFILPNTTTASVSVFDKNASPTPYRVALESSNNSQIYYRRTTDVAVDVGVRANDVVVRDVESDKPKFRMETVQAALRILPDDAGVYPTTQDVVLKGVEVADPAAKGNGYVNAGAPIDAEAHLAADVQLLPAIAGTQTPQMNLRYLITRLAINDAHLSVAGIRLLHAAGEVFASEKNPLPKGSWVLTLSGWKQMRMLLKMATTAGDLPDMNPVLDAVQGALAEAGKRTPMGDIALTMVHNGDGDMLVNQRPIDFLMMNVMMKGMKAFGDVTEKANSKPNGDNNPQTTTPPDASTPPAPDAPR